MHYQLISLDQSIIKKLGEKTHKKIKALLGMKTWQWGESNSKFDTKSIFRKL